MIKETTYPSDLDMKGKYLRVYLIQLFVKETERIRFWIQILTTGSNSMLLYMDFGKKLRFLNSDLFVKTVYRLLRDLAFNK